jgi:hypothetical protein
MVARAIRLGILLVAASACYSPYEPDCGFVCGTGGVCPDDYTCNSADNVCHLTGTSANKQCSNAPVEFDVASAMAVSNVAISITFTGVPNAAQAQDLSNYTIPGLALAGGSMLAGSTITIGTASQAAIMYTASFTGRGPFEVLGAASTSNTSVDVTYNSAPDASAAGDPTNYMIASLGVTAATVSGATVTLTTDPQAAQTYTVDISNVKRASDFEPLHVSATTFAGRASFSVASAASLDATHATVTFDAAPAPTAATTASNYAIPGLTVSAAALSGSTVTLTTTFQRGSSYTVTAGSVTRASDAEPLTTAAATFTGTDYCTDTIPDGDETDADCGGPTCTARCAMGQTCSMASDCTSNSCATTCQ